VLVVIGALAASRVGNNDDPNPSAASVAAQDHALDAANRVAAKNRARLVAALREKWQAEAAARRAANGNGNGNGNGYRVVIRRSPVLQDARFSAADLCAPARGGSRAERKARQLRRRQVLYYLNLHCPSR
jgi:hypothetical protein